MSKPLLPDSAARSHALDPTRSVLVQAPAGSGKTTLLTQRYLALLAGVSDPGEIVAITFTNASAAEMRHRILSELEKAERGDASADSFAVKALLHAEARNWKLLDQPTLLRVTTIDSFCRELALQQPLIAGLGGGLDISSQPRELYRKAARKTLMQIEGGEAKLRQAITRLLAWRDNNWKDLEDQLVEMLAKRDRWMQDFVFDRELDESELRKILERPFATAVCGHLEQVSALLDQAPGAREEAIELARFACSQQNGEQHRALAELADFPRPSFLESESIDDAHQAHLGLAQLLLTKNGIFRSRFTVAEGFPTSHKYQKEKILQLIQTLRSIPGLESALAEVCDLPPARYTDQDWQIIYACFIVLRYVAAELKTVFAEAGAVDFVEIAQIAQTVLHADEGATGEAAFAVADSIHHLLVDEFQDTSRRQHRLLGSLIAHWPEREGRTAFVVGDPLQSIYFFRDADAELFPRVRDGGLDLPGASPLPFDAVQLTANFRTAPSVVEQLNESFEKIYAVEDGSHLHYTWARPERKEGRKDGTETLPQFRLHLEFIPQTGWGNAKDPTAAERREQAHRTQVQQIVELCRSFLPNIAAAQQMESAQQASGKFRIAILGRTKKALTPIAEALRKVGLIFRAVDLESLSERPEVLDALALARALLNAEDRVAWLGVLRAPWCGLELHDIYLLTSADDPAIQIQPIPQLLTQRVALLSVEAQPAVRRLIDATKASTALRTANPTSALGSWLEQVWLQLGGAACVNANERVNLDLLWSALDGLPSGEQDLLGPGLKTVLKDLNAQPDPGSSSQIGIQLMTIHKSKGLEFEVVLVPELQAKSGRSDQKMLSWLERGVAEPGEEATEFLVAPFQTKGAEGGQSKRWVDQVYRKRERQESRRLFYVATTRAREQVHLFARPEYKVSKDTATVELVEPTGSLLHTAWPALEQEVRNQFAVWTTAWANEEAQEGELSLAAGAEVISISAPRLAIQPPIQSARGQADAAEPTGALLRRLPADFQVALPKSYSPVLNELPTPAALYTRQGGSVLARAQGAALHTLLEQLARLRTTLNWDDACLALREHLPRTKAELRSTGISPVESMRYASQAMDLALRAVKDPICQWILDPHPDAASEVRWAGMLDGRLRQVQADRVFRAGDKPGSVQDPTIWWIVDYKSSHMNSDNPAEALSRLRSLYAPQLEAYARVLRGMEGPAIVIHAGLYYPHLGSFDWWLSES